ncbi:restriction endonuclease subunit S [Clostridium perfringens]|uniref:restriction endonuclease subunit S n=1 Tax=Clostridium perfringens TaxID=1502 RepID=UPI002A19D4D0|nr:restriction endonuclease subunit S [Clostridium perfringens]
MEYTTLGEVCTIKSSKRIYQSDYLEKGIPFYRGKEISQLSRGEKLDVELYISENKYSELKDKFGKVQKGDLLITSVGTIGNTWVSDGRDFYYKDGNITQIVKNDNINTKFLHYLFKSNIIKRQYSKGTSGTAQVALTIEKLKKIKIPKVPLEYQIKTVKLLEKSQELIDKRKEQIGDLDLLVKSKFTEMFGDVFLNTKNFEMKQIKDIVTVVKGITYKPNQVNEEGTIVLRSSNIKGSKFDLNDIVRVNKKIDEKFLVEVNDILMCNRNGSERLVGKVAKIPEYNEPMTFGTFMTIIRSPYYNYLFTFFQTEAFRRQIKMQTSVAINQISIPLLESVKVPLPPIELQNQFADFVKQVDKLKFEMEKSLKELEDNFNSLMQKAFKGELFN